MREPRTGLTDQAVRLLGPPSAAIVRTRLECSRRRVGLALLYHKIDEHEGNPVRELVPALSSASFASQMRHVAECYRPVRASELVDAMRERKLGERIPVAVTFDDDLPSHVRVALPILRSAGVPATFFLCGASLESPREFWWERLQRIFDQRLADVSALPIPALQRRLAGAGAVEPTIHEMSAVIEELAPRDRDTVDRALESMAGADSPAARLDAHGVGALVDAGCEVGFHTHRHDPLPRLEDGALTSAMTYGREELAAAAGGTITAIAYPHGKADSRVGSAARGAGFSVGFTNTDACVTPESDPLLLPRIEPSRRSTPHFAVQLVRALLRGGQEHHAREG